MDESPNTASQPQRLKLLSFNIQAGTSITRYHEYVLHSWRHVLPHSQRMSNLDAIAKLIGEFDIVALQEVDAGSLRSGFVNQTRYLASHAGLPFWCQQSNRKVGRVAYAANGLVSRYQPDAVEEHRLPGTIPGRGALMTRFGEGESALILVSVHLALGRRARAQQLDYLAGELEGRRNLVVMGDLNTQVTSPELKQFLRRLDMRAPTRDMASFPSWQPQRAIDHILVSDSIDVADAEVLPLRHSDHCPVMAEVLVPMSSVLTPAKPTTVTGEVTTAS